MKTGAAEREFRRPFSFWRMEDALGPRPWPKVGATAIGCGSTIAIAAIGSMRRFGNQLGSTCIIVSSHVRNG